MNRATRGLILLACTSALFAPAQQQTAPAQQPPTGLETDWDIAAVIKDISAHAGKLLPELDKANSAAWIEKGAPQTYAKQLQSARDQALAISTEAKALTRNPEQLSACLQLFFRIEGMETMLGSVAEAMKKYQSAADAQSLIALTAENGANRERFQQYIVNLASEREKEYAVMDKEAQRCRGLVNTPPPAVNKRKK